MEEWRVVKNNSNFYISSNGRIYNKRTKRIIGKKPKDSSKYIRVNLYKNGKNNYFQLHRLVAEAFIPNPENKPFINHINGIKTDNRVENLEWCTKSENAIHAFKTGLEKPKIGEENPCSKLTERDVIYIRENYVRNSRVFGTNALAKKFGVSNTAIKHCLYGETWKNV